MPLWAHPEETQARSDHAEPLFTPVLRLKIRGGFGRPGTGCRKFRRLDRACGETLLLVVSFAKIASAHPPQDWWRLGSLGDGHVAQAL